VQNKSATIQNIKIEQASLLNLYHSTITGVAM